MSVAEEAKTALLREEHITYYHTKQVECIYHTYQRVFDGIYTSWYRNGQMANYIYYNMGKLNGEMKQWSETGRLKFHTLYENGVEIKDYLDVK